MTEMSRQSKNGIKTKTTRSWLDEEVTDSDESQAKRPCLQTPIAFLGTYD